MEVALKAAQTALAGLPQESHVPRDLPFLGPAARRRLAGDGLRMTLSGLEHPGGAAAPPSSVCANASKTAGEASLRAWPG